MKPFGSKELIKDLARHVLLAPSCFNNQPARFVFVHDAETLHRMQDALSSGNLWAHYRRESIRRDESHSDTAAEEAGKIPAQKKTSEGNSFC